MTETVIAILSFVFGFSMVWKNITLKKNIRLASELTDSSIKGLIENINRLEEENKALKLLTEPPASESAKKVDWEPDDYKDLSEAKYERFGDDEIEEVREYLTTKQRKSIGG